MSHYLNDNELVSAARTGDNEAMSDLIKAVMPCIESIASVNAGSGTITRHDLIQEGYLGAINAIYSFDESKGVRFTTYAQACITNSIYSAVKKHNRKKQRPLNAYVPLDELDEAIGGFAPAPEALVTAREEIALILKCIDEELTSLEKDVLLAHIAGKNGKAISEQLGIEPKAVANALSRARKKIKSAIGNT